MLEVVGQYGPGYLKPSYNEGRVPLLEKGKKRTDFYKCSFILKKKQVRAPEIEQLGIHSIQQKDGSQVRKIV
jgi:hypothetical protein